MPISHPDISDILSEAVAIDEPAARDAFLEQACLGDDSLKSRVEELVRMHFLAGDFLEHPAAETAESLSSLHLSLKAGARIGPYKLLQEIGEGGMGVVYMAQQDEPVKRRVALKVVKPGMDTRQVIARFEAERQALAMMDHPNIAKVFDAGMTESGRPYFVMELIHGIPITRYSDEHHLTLIDRLRLFLHVCHAVQHAHQKGIIHRDLKPGNVLVAQYDDLAVPKVIDFGVAKATRQQLTDLTLFTEFGQVMGTFEYMSPEQAKRNQLDVDTRTDVYSLGVILYELLTGCTPFDATRFRRAAIDEILRIIGSEDPPRPSTKLSSSQSLPSIAANRRLEPARLSRFVEGDLDWIVMRTLEKDRARRYATVGSLAADVQRFLNNEPVEAGPPSASYRFRKFARRHTGVLVSVSLMASLLFVSTVVSSMLAIRAMRAEKELTRLAGIDKLRAVEANEARLRAVEQALAARRSQYATNVLMARDAIERGRPETARERLIQELPEQGRFDVRSFAWYYLSGLLDQQLETLRGHSGFVLGVAYSPDGGTLATAGADRTIRLWSLEGYRTSRVLQGHEHEVNSVKFSPDGELLVSASDDETVRLWNPATGELLDVLSGHTGNVRGLAFSPDGALLATAGTDATIRLWNLADRQTIGELPGHTGEINQLAFSPDGSRLASCADDETVRVWNVASRKQVAELSGHRGHVRSVAFSPDGTLIASGGRDAVVRIWNSETYEEAGELEGYSAGVHDVTFSPDGSTLASVSEDRTVRFWDVAARQLLCSRLGHTARAYCAAYSPDGRSLATGAFDETINLWETPDAHRSIFQRHTAMANDLAFSPDGRWLASAGWETVVRLWDVANGREARILEGHAFTVRALAYAPDGRTLATADRFGVIRLWDPESGDVRLVLQAQRSAVRDLAFSDNGKLLAACSDNGAITLWNAATGEAVATLAGHLAPVSSVAFIPGARRLVSTGSDRVVRVWDLDTGRTLRILEGSDGVGQSLAVAPNGRLIAAGTVDGSIHLWDATTCERIAELRGHAMHVESLVFAPDSAFLVSCSYDKTIRLWDLQTRLDVATLAGHTGNVNCIALSRDGRRLASAGCDLTTRLWEINTTPGWNSLGQPDADRPPSAGAFGAAY